MTDDCISSHDEDEAQRLNKSVFSPDDESARQLVKHAMDDEVAQMRRFLDEIRWLVKESASTAAALELKVDAATAVRAIAVSGALREWSDSCPEQYNLALIRGFETQGFYDELLALWHEI